MQQNTHTELFQKALKLTPGGVHSPVRSFKGLKSTPRFIQKGEGAYLTDVEGKKYIDFCMSFGPLILGHQNPQVKKDLTNALDRGWSFGASEPYSLELSEYLIGRLPHIEQIRFMSSGTEAVMTALRLARGVTQKNKIIKFNGCYHGHVDSMLIKAGSGLAGESTASSSGVPEGVSKDTLIVELGDEEAVRRCFKDHSGEIAAIIVEPLPANNGLLIQKTSFLHFLREICDREKALLIFDEVISGFRIAFGGMSEKTQIKPDIVTLGKIIGGGLPVGAVGASRFIMEHLAPLGKVYQAGTLSANPLAMVGGLSTLRQLDDSAYAFLNQQTKKIVDLFNHFFATYPQGKFKHLRAYHVESLFWICSKTDVEKITELPEDLALSFNEFFELLLASGVYLAPNAYEVGFVSMAHDDSVIAELQQKLNQLAKAP